MNDSHALTRRLLFAARDKREPLFDAIVEREQLTGADLNRFDYEIKSIGRILRDDLTESEVHEAVAYNLYRSVDNSALSSVRYLLSAVSIEKQPLSPAKEISGRQFPARYLTTDSAVLFLLAQGMTSKEAAKHLGVHGHSINRIYREQQIERDTLTTSERIIQRLEELAAPEDSQCVPSASNPLDITKLFIPPDLTKLVADSVHTAKRNERDDSAGAEGIGRRSHVRLTSDQITELRQVVRSTEYDGSAKVVFLVAEGSRSRTEIGKLLVQKPGTINSILAKYQLDLADPNVGSRAKRYIAVYDAAKEAKAPVSAQAQAKILAAISKGAITVDAIVQATRLSEATIYGALVRAPVWRVLLEAEQTLALVPGRFNAASNLPYRRVDIVGAEDIAYRDGVLRDTMKNLIAQGEVRENRYRAALQMTPREIQRFAASYKIELPALHRPEPGRASTAYRPAVERAANDEYGLLRRSGWAGGAHYKGLTGVKRKLLRERE